MKKLLIFFLCLAAASGMMAGSSQAAPDWPEGPAIQAESGILMDGLTGAVLYEKNADQTYFPASITKILTALIVIENCDMDEIVTCSKNAIYNVEAKSSNAGLSEGDTLSVKDCLYALLVNSANEAANALAEHVAGTMDDFAVMMNEKAKELGCTNSNFANPSGLNNDNHFTTARDMALIAKAAFDNPAFREINSQTYYKLPPTIQDPEGLKMYVHHKMMLKSQSVYYPGIIGGKTGYTTLAGNTLVTGAERDGMRMIAVILKGSTPAYYDDTASLLDFGFHNFKNINADDNKDSYYTIDNDLTILGLETSSEPYLKLENNLITVPKTAEFTDVTSAITYGEDENLPDGAAAKITYSYGERMVGTAYLCISSSVLEETSKSEESDIDTASDSTASDSTGVSDPSSKTGTTAVKLQKEMSKILDLAVPPIVWIALLGVLGLGVLVGGLIALKIHHEKKEEAAQAVRREQRRQRLQASGYSVDEFDSLLNQKQSSYTVKKRKLGRFLDRFKR